MDASVRCRLGDACSVRSYCLKTTGAVSEAPDWLAARGIRDVDNSVAAARQQLFAILTELNEFHGVRITPANGAQAGHGAGWQRVPNAVRERFRVLGRAEGVRSNDRNQLPTRKQQQAKAAKPEQ